MEEVIAHSALESFSYAYAQGENLVEETYNEIGIEVSMIGRM